MQTGNYLLNFLIECQTCVQQMYLKYAQVYILQEYYREGGGSKIYAPFGKYLCTLCILYQFLDIWSNFDLKMQFRAPILLIFVKNYPLMVILPKNTVLTGLWLSTSWKIFKFHASYIVKLIFPSKPSADFIKPFRERCSRARAELQLWFTPMFTT